MTKISKKQLIKLKKIYKAKFWIELSDNECLEKWLQMITFVHLFTDILPFNQDEIWKN